MLAGAHPTNSNPELWAGLPSVLKLWVSGSRKAEFAQLTGSKFTLSYTRASQLWKADINGASIPQFTMATVDKKSFAYLAPVELETCMCRYGEYEHILWDKKKK